MSSGANTNTTISNPFKPGWQMMWDNGSFGNFQLDIVGFLAVLGEGAVTANYQVSSLSRLSYLPRLIPAPQALLPTTRPTELPSIPASVTGVYSGNVRARVHHIANVLLGKELDSYDVRCVRVERKLVEGDGEELQSWTDTVLRGLPSLRSQKAQSEALPTQRPQEAPSENPRSAPATNAPAEGAHQQEPPAVPAAIKAKTTVVRPTVTAKASGPLTWVTLSGFALSVLLFTISIMLGDGMSLIATILLSLLSTLIGAANNWTLHLSRRAAGDVPPGDTVVRYPNGSFLIVRCNEDIARELYFAPEQIEYAISDPAQYRFVSLVGTLILMVSIIFLANAKLELQIVWAASYMIINAAHWLVAAMHESAHWDLSCYQVKEESIVIVPPEAREGETVRAPAKKNFTQALWTVICVTGTTRWAKNDHAAPQTSAWDEWLGEAQKHVSLCSSSHGTLVEPIWPGEEGKTDKGKGKVWEIGKDWDPQEAWEHCNRKYTTYA